MRHLPIISPYENHGKNINQWDIFLCLILFSVCLLAGLSQVVPGVCGHYHDDGIYILTAKSLAEGDGYRLINLPDNLSQTKYPFLYPCLLALIWKIYPVFPQNIVIMQFGNIALAATAIALCYLCLSNMGYFSRRVIFSSLLLCSTSPLFIYFTTNVLSEILFFFLFCLMLWFFDHLLNRKSNRTALRYIALGIIISLPYLCRSIGLIFIPIALLLLFINKHPLKWTLLGIIITTLPWVLWHIPSVSAEYDPIQTYYADYTGWWMKYGIQNIIDIVIFNIIAIPLTTFSMPFWGIYKLIPNNLLVISFLLGAIPFFYMILHKQGNGSLRYFLWGYLLLVCIWPWPPGRFLVPIIPFILCYLLAVFDKLLSKLKPVVKLSILSSVIIIFLLFNITSLLDLREIHATTNYPYADVKSPETSNFVNWSSYEKVFQWVKVNTDKNDVFTNGLDTMFYLYTNRKSYRPFHGNPLSLFYGQDGPKIGTTMEFKNSLSKYKPKYLVQTPMPGFAEEEPFNELIESFRRENPQSLIPVYKGDDSRFIIYKIQY